MKVKLITFYFSGEFIKIAVPSPVSEPLDQQDDDVYKYSISFLRVALEFLLLDDIIKSGDIDSLTLMLKRLIPVVSHLINGICDHLKINQAHKHSKKKLNEDMNVLSEKLRNLRPFCNGKCRLMPSFHSIPSNFLGNIDKSKLNEYIKRHSSRAVSNIAIDPTEENEETS